MKRIILTLAALAAFAASASFADTRPIRAITCYTHCYPSGLCMTQCF